MPINDVQIKRLLSEADLIAKKSLEEAYLLSCKNKKKFCDVLIEKDLITDEHLGQFIAAAFNYDFVNLRKKIIPTEALEIIPEVMAQRHLIMIFEIGEGYIFLAMNDPENLEIIRLIEKKTGKNIKPYFATERDIKQSLVKYRRNLKEQFKELVNLNFHSKNNKHSAEEAPIIKIVDTIIRSAYENMASDIHIEPAETEVVIRYRLDGILHEVATLPKELLESIVTRIKILAKLRTDEHRAAQDGKITLQLEEENLDLRISVVPIINGEKIVMRLLSEKNRQFALNDLGIAEYDVGKVREAIDRPHGMILVTGPTGSGKSTTLYAVLKILNKKEVNISTIEDPVEYNIEGVNQIQVNPKTNLTFASGLRSIVRQDPDIIMVGEIRDEETAAIAINAALTGHLVLSTLHTNDAATTLPRLLDMQIEPFLIASTINIVIAQRLVRRICSQCLMSDVYTGDRLDILKQQFDLRRLLKKDIDSINELRLYKGKGCPTCNNSGYKGRLGIFEILVVTDRIRKLIVSKADSSQIEAMAVTDGMSTMKDDGFRKAVDGLTTVEEILRTTTE